MTAVDLDGRSIARYQIARGGLRPVVEIVVHPHYDLTEELTLAIAVSAPWLKTYFHYKGA